VCYCCGTIISLPIFFSMEIRETKTSSDTLYTVQTTELAKNHWKVYLCIYSFFIKLLPSIALTYLSARLMKSLIEVKKRKEKLASNVTLKALKNKNRANRTTKMLLAILLLFLITELPQGLFGVFSAFLHEDFYLFCYQKMGDIFDFLALINSSINFILYCFMSTPFRKTFKNIFFTSCQHSNQADFENRLNEELTQMTNL
jgi:H+/gluconate symporter-like permease